MNTVIGLSSACFFPLDTKEAVCACADAGFGKAEIFINTDSELQGEYFRELKNAVNERKMRITSVHPFTSGYENILFFAGYRRRVEDGAEYYKKYYNAAAELGGKYVVFHGNNMKTPFCGYERYCEIFSYIRSKGEPFGVELLHENVTNSVAEDPGRIRKLRETCPDMHFVFDAKQACRSGVSPYDVLDAMGDAVRHVHINDYDLKNNVCKPPFEGELDLKALLLKLKSVNYGGDMIIEVYRENFSNTDQLKTASVKLSALISEING